MSEKPDALSRRSDHHDQPLDPQVMIPPEQFIGFRANVTIDIIQDIKTQQAEDELLETLIRSTKNKDSLPPSIRKQFE